MTKSEPLSRALTHSPAFVTALVKRLGKHADADAIVLRSLLRMLQFLHEYHPDPKQFVLENDLNNVVKGFEKMEGQVLVYQIASQLLVDFEDSAP